MNLEKLRQLEIFAGLKIRLAASLAAKGMTLAFEAFALLIVVAFLVAVAIGGVMWLQYGLEPFMAYYVLSAEFWADFPLQTVKIGS